VGVAESITSAPTERKKSWQKSPPIFWFDYGLFKHRLFAFQNTTDGIASL
jgi:hypothetical protein